MKRHVKQLINKQHAGNIKQQTVIFFYLYTVYLSTVQNLKQLI